MNAFARWRSAGAQAGPRHLIINADDFGAGRGINRAVDEACRAGVVTSASLMVTRPSADEAVAMAAQLPNLSLGIHVDLDGEGGPPRVDLDDPARARPEIDRQLERFQEMVGALPTHIDVHHNLHRHRPLAPVFREVAQRIKRPLREHSPVRYFPDFYAQWDDRTHPEQVSTANLRTMLSDDIKPGITELSCHPGYLDPEFVSDYHRERELEITTLLDPEVPAMLAELGITLISYHDVSRIQRSGIQHEDSAR